MEIIVSETFVYQIRLAPFVDGNLGFHYCLCNQHVLYNIFHSGVAPDAGYPEDVFVLLDLGEFDCD